LASIIASVASTYLAAKSSMGFGHDVRAAVYKAVGSFSDREFSGFGAPTLITRNTNDVLQIQTLVMLTGGVDLSVAFTATAAAFATAWQGGNGTTQGILAGLAVGLGIGLANGIGIGIFRVNPLIMTLGTSSVTFGLLSIYAGKSFEKVVPGLVSTPDWLEEHREVDGRRYGQFGIGYFASARSASCARCAVRSRRGASRCP